MPRLTRSGPNGIGSLDVSARSGSYQSRSAELFRSGVILDHEQRDSIYGDARLRQSRNSGPHLESGELRPYVAEYRVGRACKRNPSFRNSLNHLICHSLKNSKTTPWRHHLSFSSTADWVPLSRNVTTKSRLSRYQHNYLPRAIGRNKSNLQSPSNSSF